ncbi:ABC transporter ATP-binding protein [Actinomadura nitritigenes]|uniref:ABC transporter ATP-binding protein n=1 Tax=Actinomadura nitritigenes TaxID=134602 RepID=UPI003D8A8834
MTRFRRTFRVLVADGFRAAPRPMAVAALTVLATALTQITYPLGIRAMVDALPRHDVPAGIAGTVAIAVLFTLSWTLMIVSAGRLTALTDEVSVWLSARIAALVNAVPGLEHFERPDYLAELERLERRRPMLASGPRQALTLASVAVRTAGIAVLLATVYWPLALLPLAGLPPYLAGKRSVALRERADAAVADQRRLAGELFELAATAGPAKELRTYGLGAELRARHDRLSAAARRATVRAASAGALWSALGWFLYAAAFSGAIALIAVRAARGDASAGQVVLAVSLLRRAQLTVSQASNAIGQVVTTASAAQSLLWLEDHAAVQRSGGAPAPDRLDRGITLEDVAFAYPGGGAPVLRGVDLVLPAGGTVALIGENGAGKTTLVKLLTGMYPPTSGRILLDGADLAAVDRTAWRARTSAAFQDFVKWNLRAGEAVGIGDLPRLDDEDALRTALDRAAGTGVIDELPSGLDTPLGKSFQGGADLSGGQWQKLALGRAMMRDHPLLLVLDEPTASLDAPTEDALFRRYLDAARRTAAGTGAITILVSHRFSTVRMADLIVVLDGGRVVQAGDHATLLAEGGLYAELFELQARAYL